MAFGVVVSEDQYPAKSVMIREVVTKKNPVFEPLPPVPVTVTAPVEPLPTTAVIWVVETTVKELAAVPPNVTEVMAVKFVPVIVTVCPLVAELGLIAETVGAAAEAINVLANNKTSTDKAFI